MMWSLMIFFLKSFLHCSIVQVIYTNSELHKKFTIELHITNERVINDIINERVVDFIINERVVDRTM